MEYNYYESTEKYCLFCHAPIKLRIPKNGGEVEEIECGCERSQKAKDDKCAYCGKKIEYRPLKLYGNRYRMMRISCECEVEAAKKQEEAERAAKIVDGTKRIRECWLQNSGLSKRLLSYTFDNFTPSSEQCKAYDLAFNFALDNEEHTGLIFCGGVGSGKTHLAAAMVHKILSSRQIDETRAIAAASKSWKTDECPALFISATGLLRELRDCYNSKDRSETETMHRFMSAELLLLDDLGAEKPTEWTKEKLFEIVDYRYNEFLPMVITTNCTPEELKRCVGERVFDRLRAMCLYVPIASKSHRETASN